MSSGPTTQLVVNPTRLVPFGSEDGQSTKFDDSFSEFDVGPTTGHVGGDGYGTFLPGVGDDVGFSFVLFRVQDVMANAPAFEQFAQVLRGFNRNRPDEHRLADLVARLDTLLDEVQAYDDVGGDAVAAARSALDAAELALAAAERTLADPLVIAGGPCAQNPEPMSAFVDVFVLGDGEPSLPRICDRWIEIKEACERRGLSSTGDAGRRQRDPRRRPARSAWRSSPHRQRPRHRCYGAPVPRALHSFSVACQGQ